MEEKNAGAEHRIREMDERFRRVRAAADSLETAIRLFDGARADLEALEKYLSGGLWLRDYEADEAGELPAELDRGVLSQDALYDLLGQADALRRRLSGKEEEKD